MKKKKILNKIAILFGVVLFTGCSDFLDVESDTQKQGAESITTLVDLRNTTANLYTAPWFGFNQSSYEVCDGRANNLLADATSSTYANFAGFSETSSTAGLSNLWSSLYNISAQSSYVINDYAPNVRLHVDNEAKINACEAEARFMRGTAYWYLAMVWHDVPIIDSPNSLVLSPKVYPNRFEDVIQFAINDLEYAVQWLPTSDDKGRVTKYSAEGMLARVCLTAANYAMGNNFSQDYLDRNAIASNTTLAQFYFDKAKVLTNNILTEGSASYGLLADYEDLFKVQNNNNKESLFSIQVIPTSTVYGLGNTRQQSLAGSTTLTNGLNAYGGSIFCGYDILHLYVLDGAKSRMRGNIFVATENYNYLATHTAAKSWTVTNEKCNIKKFVVGSKEDTGGIAINNNSGLMTPVMRMAEVYLMYTEAVMGTNSSTSDALAVQRFNAVRQRAFSLNIANYVAKTSVTRNDLFKERRMEFFMEGLFWQDIVRRSFYDMDWVKNYLNNKLKDSDALTELTNYVWYHYTYNPVRLAATGGFTNSPRASTVVAREAVHDLGSATYVHSVDAKDNIWGLPYPQVDASKNPLLNQEPVKFNF
ncbi:RagB/SusD family nutrient uptake outer membrane protein [Flavobacterium flavipallidum]|uniref:RagB/SusD family nutrient uptake outer membrane protein n=1 Tax=Flavobacterium flavipallidum TaxID=3139140 RepID=A0ABU9HPM7_9FLAO